MEPPSLKVPDDMALLPPVTMHGIGYDYIRCYPKQPNKFRLDTAIIQFHHSMNYVDHYPLDNQGDEAVLWNLRIADPFGCEDRDVYLKLVKPIDISKDLPNFRLIDPLVTPSITTILSVLPILSLALLSCFIGWRMDSFVRSTIPWLPVYVLGPFVGWCLEEDRPQLLDRTIALHHHVMRYYVAEQPACVALQSNLAVALLARFEQRGERNDLDEAIEHSRSVLGFTPVEQRSASLGNLAVALRTRFEQQGDMNDLNEAIEHHRSALRPVGHPDQLPSLKDLAVALRIKFEQQHDTNDFFEAIEHDRHALQLTPAEHPDGWTLSNNLATTLLIRLEHHSDINDLNEAIKYNQSALQLMPNEHPIRSMSLSNLALAFFKRFQQQGDGNDLNTAIEQDRVALRFKYRGADNDLHESIEHNRAALRLRPFGHPDRSSSSNNLALALRRFEQQGDGEDLEEAIKHNRSALRSMPVGHPYRSSSLSNLAIALVTRFEQQGDGNDLSQLTALNNLASALLTRFEQQGNGNDLNDAIERHRNALLLQPVEHPTRPMSLSNLALALFRRFEYQGDVTDLDEAVEHDQSALLLQPDQYPFRSMLLANLGITLFTRFEQQGDRNDIKEAIQHTRSALLLQPVGNPNRSTSLSNLALALLARFEKQGDGDDLNEAIEHNRSALLLRADGNPNQSMSLNNLANALLTRFERQGDQDALDEAFQLCQTAEDHTPATHPFRLNIHQTLARLQGAMEHYARATACEAASALSRLEAGLSWVQVAETHQHISQSVLDAYELLEQGRALLWTQMARFHTLLDDFRFSDPRAGLLILRELWSEVVSPVVTELEKVAEKLGLGYGGAQHLYLILHPNPHGSREGPQRRQYGGSFSFTAIGQAKPDGEWTLLQFVERELDLIEGSMLASSTTFTKLTSSLSTREAASRALQNNRWVHISCHGQQYCKEPFKSCFAMGDGPLSLLDIIDLDLSHHEFAFLSAYKTAMGDSTVPDEMIHLAAGLQFTGVKSVVGTLWQVDDEWHSKWCRNSTRNFARGIGWTVRWQAQFCTGLSFG
ncbi:hypothetical protein BS17DRAFT_768855 [Gyrodon lividus]|nr:hypothetical protein BS17DRAFT_768855 [Gyrodon lividus]